MIWIAIALGGALGAILRYGGVVVFAHYWGKGFPYATLFVNVLGSFLMGLLWMYFSQRHGLHTPMAKALMTGVLGAFTTFSTFSLETMQLLQQEAWWLAGVNIVLNLMLCLIAIVLGVLLAKFIW